MRSAAPVTAIITAALLVLTGCSSTPNAQDVKNTHPEIQFATAVQNDADQTGIEGWKTARIIHAGKQHCDGETAPAVIAKHADELLCG